MTKRENEQLAQLQTDMCWVKKILGNHLQHHQKLNIALLVVALSAVGGLVVNILVVYTRSR